MFVQLSRDEEIAAFVGSVLAGEEDNFKRRFIAMLSKLNESDWELLEKSVRLHYTTCPSSMQPLILSIPPYPSIRAVR